jgi:hypothetical protein
VRVVGSGKGFEQKSLPLVVFVVFVVFVFLAVASMMATERWNHSRRAAELPDEPCRRNNSHKMIPDRHRKRAMESFVAVSYRTFAI